MLLLSGESFQLAAASAYDRFRLVAVSHIRRANDDYDRQYVTQVEGYPGLIVHGPLIATLLLDLLRREMPGADVASFRFKAVRPTFDLDPFHVNGQLGADGKTVRLWASDHEGWLTMDASAVLR